jgi:hypothetical protein
MKNKILLCLVALGLWSCSSDDNSGSNNGGGGGGLNPQATYRITFNPNFTDATHPTDYPANAMFSGMVVVAHSSQTTVFSEGQLASDGLEAYVETGDTSVLLGELEQVLETDPPTIVALGSDVSATGQDQVQITITPSTTFLSIVSRISPSPDWFVGVDSFDLVDDTGFGLIEFESRDLAPWDAGTDAGTTYTSDDEEEIANVSIINSDPFVSSTNGTVNLVNRLGTITIERID